MSYVTSFFHDTWIQDVTRYLKKCGASEDEIQDVFLQLCATKDHLRELLANGVADQKAYLIAVARNHWHRLPRKPAPDPVDPIALSQTLGTSDLTSEEIEYEQDLIAAQEADREAIRQQLPPKKAEVALHLESGASISDAARLAGISRQSLYNWKNNSKETNDE